MICIELSLTDSCSMYGHSVIFLPFCMSDLKRTQLRFRNRIPSIAQGEIGLYKMGPEM